MSSWMAWRYRLGITGLLRIRMRRVGIEGDDAEREWYRVGEAGGTLARNRTVSSPRGRSRSSLG